MGKLEDWSKKPAEELNIADVVEVLHSVSDDALKSVYMDMAMSTQGFAVQESNPYFILKEVVTRIVKLQGGDADSGKIIFDGFVNEEAAARWYVSVCTKH